MMEVGYIFQHCTASKMTCVRSKQPDRKKRMPSTSAVLPLGLQGGSLWLPEVEETSTEPYSVLTTPGVGRCCARARPGELWKLPWREIAPVDRACRTTAVCALWLEDRLSEKNAYTCQWVGRWTRLWKEQYLRDWRWLSNMWLNGPLGTGSDNDPCVDVSDHQGRTISEKVLFK